MNKETIEEAAKEFQDFKQKHEAFKHEVEMIKKYTGYIRKNYDHLTIIKELQEKGFDGYTSEGVHKLLFYNIDGTKSWDWVDSILTEKYELLIKNFSNKPQQPKDIESLRGIMKDFSYYYENAHTAKERELILDEYIKKIHPKEQPKENDAKEFAQFIRDFEGTYSKGVNFPTGLTIDEAYNIYQEYLKTKQ